MAVVTSTMLGRPVWHELMTTDMKTAESLTRPWWVGRRAFAGAANPTRRSIAAAVGVGGIMEKPAEVKAPPFGRYIAVLKLEDAVSHITGWWKTHTDVITIKDVGRCG
jgi:predicted enzyme related to lactoylglutathione lyase